MKKYVFLITTLITCFLCSQSAFALSEKDISAEEWFQKGMTYLEANQYEKAIDAFSKTLDLNLRYARAYINRGNAWSKKGDYDRSISDYTKALQIDPSFDEAKRTLKLYNK